MEILGLLSSGLLEALQPINLLLIILGVTLGLFIGMMPGLGSVNGVAILLPITFLVPPASAIIFLAAIYYGAMYGGAISSITLGIPGASTAVATTFDGRPLAMKGRASLALVTAGIASFVGGTVSIILFTMFAPLLASVALSFGSPEVFALMLLAFATFVGLGGDDIPKTILSICLGLVFAAVGFDEISGAPRLVFFDISGFLHGINFLVLAIGVYGIGEMLWTIDSTRGKITSTEAKMSFKGVVSDTKESLQKGWTGMSIGSFLGFFVGILPAAGATPGSLMSYGVAKLASKNPSSYGKGNPNGVAAPEAANNSASTGSMLPMLTLGIPGSPTTAILLGGMVIWGLTPGPRLFTDQPEFVWGLIGSFYVSNFFALVVNLSFIPLFIWMLRMPFTILAPMIFVLSIVGGYAATRDMHDVWLMLAFGLSAFFLRKFDYPLAPAVLAIVLGPIAEPTLRQSLLLSSGDPMIFLNRPIAGPITVIAIILILLPLFKAISDKFRKQQNSDT
ncbi:MAG: tripartite tricarboxylate transporter permease [Tateyamaria sp.]|jgi:putative tricarboxylic transport membrane protein|nr:tripartite tricarboxylate transporter permease [Tateyamaria sp.]MCH9748779.1 tripartite tricarboxylate transporter permease [Alphaproteobacteria bacterium]HAB39093.1 tricarboxylate transporter [Paracoccaceae bacterium]MBT5300840.1 tripartite tricarboxylate transporter permease [Tateyamaria sp.]MBT6344453.1 tripartite tricarboxylate transporter permease [Tateyamaria sp.]